MIWKIVRKELAGYFHSPIALIVLTFFTAIVGLNFYTNLTNFILATTPSKYIVSVSGYNVNDHLLKGFFENIASIMLLIVPVVTMRLIAEEKRQGTMDLLYSYSIRPWQLVVGKYLGALLLTMFLLLISAIYPIYVIIFSQPQIPSILTSYFGLFLLLLFYVAAGLYASSVTDNQLIAAIICIAIGSSFLLVKWLAVLTPAPYDQFFQHFLLFSHMASFNEGAVFGGDVVAYPTIALVFLFLCYRRIKIY